MMFDRVEARRSAATAESGAAETATSLSGSADAESVLGVSDRVVSSGFRHLDANSASLTKEKNRADLASRL
jgi:hypothetical protein